MQAKTPEELSALVAKARAEEAAAWRMRHEQEEKARFFYQHNARADINHWSKATYWTLDEAVALTFGKNPEVVTWEKIRGLTSVSEFAAQFARVRDLVFRAKNWQQLYDPALPTFFLAWAQRNEIGVPDELVKAVEARGVVIADWKDLHDSLKEQFDALVEDRAKVGPLSKSWPNSAMRSSCALTSWKNRPPHGNLTNRPKIIRESWMSPCRHGGPCRNSVIHP